MIDWLRNIYRTVATVFSAMWVTIRYSVRTYDPDRRTFTEQYEYPELPLVVAPRFHGFHRWKFADCIACGRCAKDCPTGCIYIGRKRAEGRKGFEVTSFTIDYTKCMFCALCTESCSKECLLMGSSHDLGCYDRDGCIVDFARLPPEIAWGQSTLDPTVVALSKLVVDPVAPGDRCPADA